MRQGRLIPCGSAGTPGTPGAATGAGMALLAHMHTAIQPRTCRAEQGHGRGHVIRAQHILRELVVLSPKRRKRAEHDVAGVWAAGIRKL